MKIPLGLVVLLSLAMSAPAQPSYRGSCDVLIRASATMHDFKGKASADSFPVAVTGEGDDVLLSWKTDLSPFSIGTDEADRDKEVQRTLKADAYPFLRGEAKNIRLAALRAEDAELAFVLAVAGIERPVAAVITGWKEADGQIAFDASFDVSMKEFGLHPKSMLGLIRVHDKVRVTCHFDFSASSS